MQGIIVEATRVISRFPPRLGIALFLIAILRIPAFRWQVISDDEAIYHSMARLISQGGIVYRDAVDHKPPGLVYFYSVVERFSTSGFPGFHAIDSVHFAGMLLALLTGVGLYQVSLRLIRRDLAWIPPALYGIVTATKCAYDGLAVNGELLMNLPTVFGVLFLVRACRAQGIMRCILDFCAGALIGIAGLVKWQALITGVAFPVLALESGRGTLTVRALFWLLGVCTPILLVSGYFYRVGALPEAWYWGLLFNFKYIKDGTDPAWALHRFLIQLGAVILPSFIFYGAALKGGVEAVRRRDWRFAGLIAWAGVSVLAVCVGGRFFGHYFLQAELPLSLLAAEPVHQLFRRAPRRTLAAIGVPAAFFFFLSLSPRSTRALFDRGAPDWARIGGEIAARSSPRDLLFVWGNVPPLYFFSHRRMGTRFSFCNYLTGLSPATRSEYDQGPARAPVGRAWLLLLADLDQRRPELFLDTSAAGWKGYGRYPLSRYPRFASYIVSHYRLDSRIDGAILYRRID